MSTVDLSALYYGPQGSDAEWVCHQVSEWITAELGQFVIEPVVYEGMGMFAHHALKKADAPRILQWFVDTFSGEIEKNCKHKTLSGRYCGPVSCTECGQSFDWRSLGDEYIHTECGRRCVYVKRELAQNNKSFVKSVDKPGGKR